MDIKRKIEELVIPILQNSDLYLVDVIISGGENVQKILILLDSDTGVDIDQCAKISRELGERIEELELVSNAYILEVSSPGLDYPLQSIRQYKKNIGRQVKIALTNDKIIKGKLLEVKEDKIRLGEEKKSKVKGKSPEITEVEINLSDIKKTNVLASFK